MKGASVISQQFKQLLAEQYGEPVEEARVDEGDVRLDILENEQGDLILEGWLA
jgi:hypothetical protein